MGFEVFCATLIALLLGAVLMFGGYRLFLILLPIWGFFFGFALGAQTVTLLFGEAFFATVTGWVVGFFVGLIFGLLSYLFYAVAVAVIAGSLGYGIGVGLMGLIGLEGLGFLTWLVGIVLAIVVIFVTFRWNLQKYVIIVATAAGGAAVVIGTFLLAFGNVTLAELGGNPVRAAISASFWWTLFWIVLAVLGIVVQLQANRSYEIEAYDNRI